MKMGKGRIVLVMIRMTMIQMKIVGS